MPLTDTQRTLYRGVLSSMTDEAISAPLWDCPPLIRPLMLSERRRRNILQNDPEPIGDPEYT